MSNITTQEHYELSDEVVRLRKENDYLKAKINALIADWTQAAAECARDLHADSGEHYRECAADLHAVINALKSSKDSAETPNLEWRRENPTEAGLYWYVSDSHPDEIQPLEVINHGSAEKPYLYAYATYWRGMSCVHLQEHKPGLIWGPIPKPTLPKGGKA